MTSCLSFAKSSWCEFVSKALRLFNSQRSSRFVVAQHSVHPVTASQFGAGGLDAQRSCAPPSGTIVGWAIPSAALLGQVCSPEAHSPDRTVKLAFSWLWFLSVSWASLVPPAAGLCPEGVYPGKERRDFPYRVLRDPLTGTMSLTG